MSKRTKFLLMVSAVLSFAPTAALAGPPSALKSVTTLYATTSVTLVPAIG